MAMAGISAYAGYSNYPGYRDYGRTNNINIEEDPRPADPDKVKKNGRRSTPEECETCKSRKYQDGSNENVSFKSPKHVSPSASGAAVRAHEAEHVANAYSEAAKNNGEVLSAGVTIHTSICPECGSVYTAGGETRTVIKYTDESNSYQKNQKAIDAAKYTGANIDYAA